MKIPRAFALHEVLTEDEIERAIKLYRRGESNFHTALLDRIVTPVWPRIVVVLGDCSPHAVAYGIEYRLLKMRKQKVPLRPRDGMFNRGRRTRRPKTENLKWAMEQTTG